MLRCMKHERPDTRRVQVGHDAGAALGEEPYYPEKYNDNRVITSKYTLLTFLPKNLFEQFRRIANFYFLVVGIIQLLIDTPVTPITSILPLVFVISVTAIKQGYEDWLRHKADAEVNYRRSTVVDRGHLKDCKSMNIKVGDIVRVQINEEFPCDMVMLSSSDSEGKCYIMTANLDGETNLKTQTCIYETKKYQKDSEFEGLQALIECEQPVPDLYSFKGRIYVMQNGERVLRPLTIENILLRGARLKNTTYVYGCAVYTGQETKMALNSKFKKTKFSRIERRMNVFLMVFILSLFLSCAIFTGLKQWYTDSNQLPWYIPSGPDSLTVMHLIESFLSFTVLFNYIIPISLYVTVELQKFCGSMFFAWDVEMYDESNNHPAQANTSDLNEELGQVEYLFSDKTGTLTENQMCFRMCSIDGTVYEEIEDQLCLFPEPGQRHSPVTAMTPKMEEFFTVLALCHTVRVDHTSGGDLAEDADVVYSATGFEYNYQASSPDEKALVEACRRYGIVYHGMREKCMEVSFQTEWRRYKVLHILEFTSVRRCMSIIVQNENGEIYLLVKGAEIAIFDMITNENGCDLKTAKTHVNEFAKIGLRSLAIAHRKLTTEEYQRLDALLTEAETSLEDREKKLQEAYEEVEQKLCLLGITAVEDKLQDLVPETISSLRRAGIKVWVLTGDKEETAVNISYSTSHFNIAMTELRLTQLPSVQECRDSISAHFRRVMAEPGQEYALIVDGQSLAFALTDLREELSQLCQNCIAVLCCRMSPIQKAQVVRMMKQTDKSPVTAAIGDGANDVSMIQEAHVGLGIMGKEGRQAVRCSDYAFSKFRFLSRALLFHGHYYYIRLAILVQYSFYKNIAFIMPQIFYQIFAALSQQSLYDPFYLLFYNITFTSLPILIYSLFEQHIYRDKLLNNPSLYRRITRNATLSNPHFLLWTLLGVWHGAVCFFGVFLLLDHKLSVQWDGKLYGLSVFGTITNIAIIFVVNLKLALITHYWSWVMLSAYCISAVGNLALSFVVSCFIWPDLFTDNNSFYWVQLQLMSSPAVWLCLLVIIVVALLPDFLLRSAQDIKNHLSIYRPERYRSSGDCITISFTKRSGKLTISQEQLVT